VTVADTISRAYRRIFPDGGLPEWLTRMAEKVEKLGVHREKDFMYYVKDASVWRVQRKQPHVPKGKSEKVSAGTFKMDSEFIYFVDRDGDVSRAKRAVGGQKRKKTVVNPPGLITGLARKAKAKAQARAKARTSATARSTKAGTAARPAVQLKKPPRKPSTRIAGKAAKGKAKDTKTYSKTSSAPSSRTSSTTSAKRSTKSPGAKLQKGAGPGKSKGRK
jgi:hypothetical protein